MNSFYAGKSLGYTSWMQIKDVAPSYALAALLSVAVYFFKYLPISNFIILPIQLIVGFGLFFVICEAWKPEEYIELKVIVKHEYKKLFRK